MDWYPWGDEALRRAREEDRPIFLSIGYASCHWCHVMSRESFSDPAVARLLNQHFVCIKVDREERPDLDAVYQLVCQLVTGQGGWPLTAVLTPDLRPFFVGTYLPPRVRYGRPGLADILPALAEAWRQRRQEVLEVAADWSEAVRRADTWKSPGGASLSASLLSHAVAQLLRCADRQHGGHEGAPKFPQAEALRFLLDRAVTEDDGQARSFLLLTLQRMMAGGLWDQLEGGFHRYCVDAAWQIPHFEKMLYDNALLARLYADAYAVTGDDRLREVATRTLQYLLARLRAPEGGFYSAEDADSEGEEGRYYLWTREEVEEAVGKDDAPLLWARFGVAPGRRCVLTAAATEEELAAQLELPVEEVARRCAQGVEALRRARARRPAPAVDDSVLTGWNGLALSALARGSQVLDDPSLRDAAEALARFLLSTMRLPGGRLLRRYARGQAGIPGFLEDYAYLTAGLLELYETTFAEEWLVAAAELARHMVRLFWDPEANGFRLVPAGEQEVFHRPRALWDAGTPAPESVAVEVLLRLHPFSGDEELFRLAERALDAHAALAAEEPWGMSSLLSAVSLYVRGAVEITVVGEENDPQVAAWVRDLHRRYIPGRVLTRIGSDRASRPLPAVTGRDSVCPPIWEGKKGHAGCPTVYVCRERRCSPPLHDWREVQAWLEG